MRRQQGDWESPMRSAISAVESEDYEQAARLRDELRRMEGEQK